MISNGSDVLISLSGSDFVTNCITEIPQDIKLEFNNGTLTLKAGSKVYVPNGANVYNAVTISSDMTLPKNSAEKYFIFLKDNGAIADTMPLDYCYTGKFQPTITHTYAIWHDTGSYKIKWTGDNGSTWVDGYSFPICVVYNNTPGTQKVSSIEQVFNGFGYIGKTIFALPGVKGLIPNGRNADGSLKNTEFRYDSVKYVTFGKGEPTCHIACFSDYITLKGTLDYDEKFNLNWLGSKYTNEICDAGLLSIDSSNFYAITSFTPKTTFNAVDYNDFEANDANVVHKTDNETISDTKTFTNPIKRTFNSIDANAAPAQNQYIDYISPYDKNGESLGYLGIANYADGKRNARLGHTRKKSDGSYLYAELSVGTDKYGNVFTNAPTPPTTDNSTQIATTAFVHNRIINIMDDFDNVVERYNDGKNWYRVYKSGWIEQGGLVDNEKENNDWNKVVSLLKPLSTNYTLVVSDINSSNNYARTCSAKLLTETSFTILSGMTWARDNKSRYACWYACGQGA